MPPNVLTATKLAEYAVELAEKYDMDYKVLEKEEMEDLGMGALLAVNQGSVEPPKRSLLFIKERRVERCHWVRWKRYYIRYRWLFFKTT